MKVKWRKKKEFCENVMRGGHTFDIAKKQNEIQK